MLHHPRRALRDRNRLACQRSFDMDSPSIVANNSIEPRLQVPVAVYRHDSLKGGARLIFLPTGALFGESVVVAPVFVVVFTDFNDV